jgi:DNA topoisomerase III
MRLYICEKPSQAKDIAKHVGARQSGQGCITGAGVTVTWCFGHILEQADPDFYVPELKVWNLDLLPVIPNQWKLLVIASSKAQYRIVATLLKSATEVVVATDADREGEVIAREVMQLAGYRGPVTRLWLGALDDASVKKALAKPLPGAKTLPLYFSGLGRARADWLTGMNITMALTKAFGAGGKGSVLHCGRVQTPVLGMVVRRERAIANFKPKTYFVINAIFEMMGTMVTVNWIPAAGVLDKDGHVVDRVVLDTLAAKIKGKFGRITGVQATPEREAIPLLYSLDTLQREASRMYGIKAVSTLDACQALYEKHKATSYPRTDCEYVPTSMFADAAQVLAAVTSVNPGTKAISNLAKFEKMSRSFNDKKITAHHAIIPTVNSSLRLADLSSTELKIYTLIVTRYLAQFLGDYEFTKTIVNLSCEAENFTQSGKTPTFMGWKRAYEGFKQPDTKSASKTSEPSDDEGAGVAVMLPAVKSGDQVNNRKAEVATKQTKPPKRYTEDTLLGAMDSVDKEIEDPRLKKIMQTKEKAGIGTGATRASIIDYLIKREYVQMDKKNFMPSQRGIQLIELIEKIEPSLADPVLTAIWEDKLAQIEAGTLTLDAYESELGQWLRDLIVRIKAKAGTMQVAARASGNANGASKAQATGVGRSNTENQAAGAVFPCSACKKPLRLRTSARGPFWGCSGYPDCKESRPDDNGKPGVKPAYSNPVGSAGGQGQQTSSQSQLKQNPAAAPAPLIFLKVSFEEKDKAKALGARWHGDSRSWYVPAGVNPELFKQWIAG